jgi:hypothetical protein
MDNDDTVPPNDDDPYMDDADTVPMWNWNGDDQANVTSCNVTFVAKNSMALVLTAPVPEFFYPYPTPDTSIPPNQDNCQVKYGDLSSCVAFFNPTFSVIMITLVAQALLLADIIFNYVLMSLLVMHTKQYDDRSGQDKNSTFVIMWRLFVGPYGVLKIVYALTTIVMLSIILHSYECNIPDAQGCRYSQELASVDTSATGTTLSRLYILLKDFFHIFIMLQRLYFFKFGSVPIIEKEKTLMLQAKANYCRRALLIENRTITFNDDELVEITKEGTESERKSNIAPWKEANQQIDKIEKRERGMELVNKNDHPNVINPVHEGHFKL